MMRRTDLTGDDPYESTEAAQDYVGIEQPQPVGLLLHAETPGGGHIFCAKYFPVGSP